MSQATRASLREIAAQVDQLERGARPRTRFLARLAERQPRRTGQADLLERLLQCVRRSASFGRGVRARRNQNRRPVRVHRSILAGNAAGCSDFTSKQPRPCQVLTERPDGGAHNNPCSSRGALRTSGPLRDGTDSSGVIPARLTTSRHGTLASAVAGRNDPAVKHEPPNADPL